MIVDFNKDKRVRITKPGIFDGAIGTIKSIKIEVDLGSQGLWSFKPDEMELFDSSKHGIEEVTELTPEMFNEIKKRTYKKREPKASDKPKRKYTRKNKEN